LQQWGFEDEIQRREKQLRRATPDPQKNWHVDLMGNTFVLFGPIESFQMGLNKDLAAISSFDPTSILDETRHSKRVPRRFGISTHEITIEQFEEFEEELIGMFERQVEAYKSQISKLKSSPVVSNEEQPERDDTKKESSKSAKQSKAKRIKAFENGIRRAKLKIENIARNQKRRVGLDQRVPIGEVDFYLSLGYCRWLSEKNGLSSGLPSVEKLQDFYDAGISDFRLDESNLSLNGYRLPTTSEWEFACRGNSDTIFPFGTNTELADRYAWFASNSGDSRHPVGRLKPGTTGLFDMLGNASEWCLDYYRKDLPALSAELGREYFVDFGPEFARRRSLTREFRGGSFANEIKDVRSTKRFSTHPGKGLPRIGFRLVRTYEAQSPAN
jgi:formylglycine-generating enzyme required for sulfatase activity